MLTLISCLYIIFTFAVFSLHVKTWIWDIGTLLYLIIAPVFMGLSWFTALFLWSVFIGILLVRHIPAVRSSISLFIFKRAHHALPTLSATEEEALNAGDTWLEKDIFTSSLDWQKLSHIKTALTQEEQAFLDHETHELCSMLDEWTITQEHDLPPSVWAYMKEKGFFGLVIAKEYGGKGFSARAHSDVVMKIATRCGVAAVTVMVPNSLGPGELLQHYGTEKQKNYFLPRLARGEDIPCFALTEPEAGSDATSIQSEAIVVQRSVKGVTELGLKLKLNKRWITLSPVATLIGLAVLLKDPEGLLKGFGQEGITCLLMPRDTKNLIIGNRHLPSAHPFMNGTLRGEDIYIPITSIIGGQEQAGHGWQMLVDCLSIGRSISLPALATATSGIAYLTTGAFARIRRQFHVNIGQFEGVEEKLAPIAGLQYVINATRLLTLTAVDQHKKPSVASAITKYFNTELARSTINDAMDVHGGRLVVAGPRNYLLNCYQGIPISVTVEGANIMTRNLLIFGQGAMACHPFLREEFYAISRNNPSKFNTLLWEHISYFVRHFAQTVSSAWTGGLLLRTPPHTLKRQYQKLRRLSYAYAWLADLSLIYLGGRLKRKERLSARLADGMSYLYMAMATLWYTEQNGNDPDLRLHAQWGTAYCFYHAQKSMIALCRHMPFRPLGFLLRLIICPWGQSMHYPSDHLDHQLAELMMTNNTYRNILAKSVYLSQDPNQPVDRVEHALQLLIQYEHLYKKVKDIRRYTLADMPAQLASYVKNGQLTQQEADDVLRVEEARWDAIQVDEFTFDAMKHKIFTPVTDFDKVEKHG